MILVSIITCPKCGYQQEEMMPDNACWYYYQCNNCQDWLKPLSGDCCVFCSFGTVKCPPVQLGDNGCD